MWLAHLAIAGKVLIAHKLRSFLTVLSITIGACSIVLMSSLAQSGLTTLMSGVEELGGGRLIFVAPKPAEREEARQASYAGGLTARDRDVLFARLPYVVEHSMFTTLGRQDLIADDATLGRADLVAADGDFFAFTRMRLERGRFFDAQEDERHGKVCVVGANVARTLWGGDAIGRTLVVDGVRCRVVGQASAVDHWGVDFGFDWLDFVALPLETANEVDGKARTEAQLRIKTDDQRHNDAVKRIVNALLVERHHGIDDFQIFDMAGMMKKFQIFFAVLRLLVAFLAGIALVVGGVGVMNMMLVSASERVREIGIRKAIGATERDIGAQFLLEAMVLAGGGGAIGIAGGIGWALAAGAIIGHVKTGWITVVPLGAIVGAGVVSLGVGLVFGWIPARRAARLDAITAIRSE